MGLLWIRAGCLVWANRWRYWRRSGGHTCFDEGGWCKAPPKDISRFTCSMRSTPSATTLMPMPWAIMMMERHKVRSPGLLSRWRTKVLSILMKPMSIGCKYASDE